MNVTNQWQDLIGDLRFAARSLRRNQGFTATAMISLALGVALTASTLSVMNSYVVRAMPFPKSERLYRALYDSPGQPEPRGLERVDWESLADVVEVADYSGLGRFILHTDNYPQEISALECAPGALEAIGVRAVLGRVFSVDDFRPGGERVIMIGNALWRERFGASPSVLGQTIRVSAATSGDTPTEYRIIGVLPPGFRDGGHHLRDPADAALPLTPPRAAYMVRCGEGVATGGVGALGPEMGARLGRPVPGGVSALAMDGTVLLWIGGIGLLIAVIVAWLPLIGVRPARLADSLRGENRGGTDRPTVRRAPAVLIALEVAASTALLIGGGLMLRSVAHLVGTNLGYETNHVFRPRIQLPRSNYQDAASFARFYDHLEERPPPIPNPSFALSTFVPVWN